MSDAKIFIAFAKALLEKAPPQPPPIFTGDAARIEAGLAVYRNNVRASLSRALGEAFPVVKKLVGDAFFKFLAHEYFHACPPHSPLVRRYGDALPEFLQSFAPAQDHPYLADVARLEIAWLDAYHAPDAPAAAPEDVVAAADGDLAALRLTLHPSLRLLSSPYPIATLWRRNQADGDGGRIRLAQGENVLIARPDMDVHTHALGVGAFAAVAALRNGRALSAAIAIAADKEDAFEPQAFFHQLFQYRIITGAEAGEETPS